MSYTIDRRVTRRWTYAISIILFLVSIQFHIDFFNPSDIAAGEFEARIEYPAGDGPHSVFLADLNGDGFNDTVTANYYGNNVAVLINNGNGTFPPPIFYDVDVKPRSLCLGDVDHDLDIDIITGNIDDSDTVTILFNNGDGTFQGRVEYGVGDDPRAVFAIDVGEDTNNDLDIITANYWSSDVSVLLNNNDGTFSSGGKYATGSGPYGVFAIDFDGDGDNDIATANYLDDNISILLNNGDGTFKSEASYPGDDGPRSIFSADLDGVNKNDIIVANRLVNNVSIFLNNGDGTFAPHKTYVVGPNPLCVYAKDTDGDGDIDLVTANNMGNSISILKNNGDGTFASKIDKYVGAGPYSVFIADVGEDTTKDMEIVTANNNADTITVLFSNTPPTITIVEPDGINDLADHNFLITWIDLDPDDDASISLYYYDEALWKWELIISGISEDDILNSYEWNTTSMPEGDYPLKALISDPFHTYTNYSIGNVTIQHTQSNIRPWISILEPDGINDLAQHNYTIQWMDSDPDNNAKISLFYDIDNTGCDGIWIADLDEDDLDFYVWNTTFMPEGKWFIYAVIQDPWHSPFYNYSAGPLTIDHTSTIPPNLKDGKVTPISGFGGDFFNFTVNYSHLLNQMPLEVTLNVSASAQKTYSMLEENAGDKYYVDGKIFYYNLSLSEGVYSFHFAAWDGTFWNETGEIFNCPVVLRSKPKLSNEKVTPIFGLETTHFNFTVIYSSYDNFSASTITLNLTGPSGGNFLMTETEIHDTNNTDGKEYFFNTTLFVGSYSYHFAASDGLYWVETMEIMNSPIVSSGEPYLTDAKVDPSSGFSGQNFNYTVIYIDPNNDLPTEIWINITGYSGGNFILQALNSSDTNCVDGKSYYLNLSLLEGVYSYHFSASDGIYWVESEETFNFPQVINNVPSLSNELVTPTTGFGGQNFNFTVIYTDVDNEIPANITLNLTSPLHRTFTMIEANPSDTNYADGKVYYYNLSLIAGTYSHHFWATDGNYCVQTLENVGSPNVLNNMPSLSNASINPLSGNNGDIFNFMVIYTDIDNDPPLSITLNITYGSGGTFTMIEDDPNDLDFTDGKLYLYSKILFEGTYSFHFAVTDGNYWVETQEFLNSPIIITPGKPSLIDGKVMPSSGFSGQNFNFLVTYIHSDNNLPTEIWVNITGPSGGNFIMTEADSSDTNCIDGKFYNINLTFLKGVYSYHFAASDGSYWAETLETSNSPQVLDNIPLLLDSALKPSTGWGGQYFNFTVIYTDADNEKPVSITLNVTGPTYRTIEMMQSDPSDMNYVDGKEYYYVLSLPAGAYSYHFAVSYGNYWIETEETLNSPNVLNNMPSLSSELVEPTTGYGGQNFNFTVRYIDPDNEAPLSITVNITGPSGGIFILRQVDPNDTNFVDGKLYYYETTLSTGMYSYHFSTTEGNYWVETSEILDSLTALNNPPWIKITYPTQSSLKADDNLIITWQDFDPDDDAVISLYYDTDAFGHDGILILSNISEDDESNTYKWSTLSIPNGTYYIYALINDNTNQLVYNYSAGFVKIEHSLDEEVTIDGKEKNLLALLTDFPLSLIIMIIIIAVILSFTLLAIKRRRTYTEENILEEESEHEIEDLSMDMEPDEALAETEKTTSEILLSPAIEERLNKLEKELDKLLTEEARPEQKPIDKEIEESQALEEIDEVGIEQIPINKMIKELQALAKIYEEDTDEKPIDKEIEELEALAEIDRDTIEKTSNPSMMQQTQTTEEIEGKNIEEAPITEETEDFQFICPKCLTIFGPKFKKCPKCGLSFENEEDFQ